MYIFLYDKVANWQCFEQHEEFTVKTEFVEECVKSLVAEGTVNLFSKLESHWGFLS